jgi:hypothetical protein
MKWKESVVQKVCSVCFFIYACMFTYLYMMRCCQDSPLLCVCFRIPLKSFPSWGLGSPLAHSYFLGLSQVRTSVTAMVNWNPVTTFPFFIHSSKMTTLGSDQPQQVLVMGWRVVVIFSHIPPFSFYSPPPSSFPFCTPARPHLVASQGMTPPVTKGKPK